MELLAAAALGAVVGLALGLTGGGGSIFALPLLIYGLGLAPAPAVTVALVGVAVTASVGAVQAIRHDLVVWQPSLMLIVGGAIGAPLGAVVAHRVAESWLVVGFAALAVGVGISMWRSARNPEHAAAVRAQPYGAGAGPICVLAPDGQLRFSAPCALVLAAIGLGTGFLSGLFGVGGGFLIVPALVIVTRMGVHRAVATSLLIICVVSAAGAASALLHGNMLWGILTPFALAGGVAMLVARRVARRVAGATLQRAFALGVIAMGLVMLGESFLAGRTG